MLQYQIIPVTSFQQNTTLLWDDYTKEAILIDAGGEVEKLKQIIKDKQLTLVGLWITHAHLDHVGAVGALAEEFGVPVIGPQKEDQFWLDALIPTSKAYGFPVPQDVKVTQWLEQGDHVQFGNNHFEVRYTPGHTPGHVIFYSPTLKTAWVGDVLFAGSIGRTDFPRGNHQQLIDSIQSQLLSLPDDTTIVSGHGPLTTIGVERKSNPFLI